MSEALFEPLAVSAPSGAAQMQGTTYWQEVWNRYRSHRFAVTALCLLGLVVLFAVVAPWISPSTYYDTHLALHDQAPSRSFWFGTDDLGRDIFCRVAYGARISLTVGLAAAFLDVVIGVLIGGISGYTAGKLDVLLMRGCDVLYSIPYLLVVILLTVVMGSGLLTIVMAMSITGWIQMARMVRGEVVALKMRPFVTSAQALGASHRRILFRHILPNALGPILVTMTFTIPTAIFTESFLSFLGLGVQAPIASWGTMVADSLSAMRYYPWRLAFPAGFMSATILAFYVVGDALRQAMDPKLR